MDIQRTGHTIHNPIILRHAPVVDPTDEWLLAEHKWYRKPHNGHWVTFIEGSSVTLHRLILQPKLHAVVDHIDGNPDNNRRSNLRISTQRVNMRNVKRRQSAPFKGVEMLSSGRYRARICRDGRLRPLGIYDTAELAARAFDAAARMLPGSTLNFPEVGERSAITGEVRVH